MFKVTSKIAYDVEVKVKEKLIADAKESGMSITAYISKIDYGSKVKKRG